MIKNSLSHLSIWIGFVLMGYLRNHFSNNQASLSKRWVPSKSYSKWSCSCSFKDRTKFLLVNVAVGEKTLKICRAVYPTQSIISCLYTLCLARYTRHHDGEDFLFHWCKNIIILLALAMPYSSVLTVLGESSSMKR